MYGRIRETLARLDQYPILSAGVEEALRIDTTITAYSWTDLDKVDSLAAVQALATQSCRGEIFSTGGEAFSTGGEAFSTGGEAFSTGGEGDANPGEDSSLAKREGDPRPDASSSHCPELKRDASSSPCPELERDASSSHYTELELLLLTAELEWWIGGLVSRRNHLKEMLAGEEIRELLGPGLTHLLRFTLGDVKGANLKNLAWHGFLSPLARPWLGLLREIRCLLETRSARPNRPHPPLPPLPIVAHPALDYGNIAETSALIHPGHRGLWRSVAESVPRGCELFPLAVSLFQHCLRRLWVAAMATAEHAEEGFMGTAAPNSGKEASLGPNSGEEASMATAAANNFEEAFLGRVTANNSEFYITLDEVFGPGWSGEVARPGASYYSNVYCATSGSRDQGDGSRDSHVLLPILGRDLFFMLLDIFVHGEGPRLRDKMSHGECGEVGEETCRHVTGMIFRILGLFAEEELPVEEEKEEPYPHTYHPWEMVRQALDETEESLCKFEGLMTSYEMASDVTLPTVFDQLRACLQELKKKEEETTPPAVPLFLGPDKVKHYKLALAVTRNLASTAAALTVRVVMNLDLLATHQLRSRQRQNLAKVMAGGPVLVGAMRAWRPILYRFIGVVEGGGNVDVRGMRGYLKCFENCLSTARSSKWDNLASLFLNCYSSRK